LDKEVYSSKEFKDYAKKNLVLVKVDFPMKKRQSEALKQANEALKRQFEIEGFPTMVILDSEGHKLGQDAGYDGTGPKPVIATLEKLKKK
jgi:protein disulfide-isomerase